MKFSFLIFVVYTDLDIHHGIIIKYIMGIIIKYIMGIIIKYIITNTSWDQGTMHIFDMQPLLPLNVHKHQAFYTLKPIFAACTVLKNLTWIQRFFRHQHSAVHYAINTLWTELFFSSFFGTYPKIGSFHLPTHRRDAHRKFFWWSLLKIELKFWWKGPPVSSWALKG